MEEKAFFVVWGCRLFPAHAGEQGLSLNEALEPGGCSLVPLGTLLGSEPCLSRSSSARVTQIEGLHYGRTEIDPHFIRLLIYLRGRGRLVAIGTDS